MTVEPNGSTEVASDDLKQAAIDGWNACRREVYLLAEDTINKYHDAGQAYLETTQGAFSRGRCSEAKSFAKAFAAFEAEDCDFLKPVLARIPASITAEAVAALKLAVGHIEHMSAWIAGQNVGYPLEGLGEDLPGIRAALSAAAHPLPQGEAGPAVIDIEASFWGSIKEAALKSPWIPPEYFVNDWVSDICRFLSEPHPLGDTEPGDLVEPDLWLCNAPAGVVSNGRSEASRENVQSYRDRGYTCEPYFSGASLSSLRAERDEARDVALFDKAIHSGERTLTQQAVTRALAAEQRVVELREKLDDSETEYLTECRNSQRLDELRAKAEQRVVELERERDRLEYVVGDLNTELATMTENRDFFMKEAHYESAAKTTSEQRVAALEGALKRCVAIVDHAVEHYKGAVATKIRREITLHVRAALRPAETGDGQP